MSRIIEKYNHQIMICFFDILRGKIKGDTSFYRSKNNIQLRFKGCNAF